MKKIFLFPGQGSQKIGMGKALAENFTEAKRIFEEVDDALNFKLSDLIWNGDMEKLTLKENAQPAIMVNSLAIWNILKSEGLFLDADCIVAGHSLGEYSALCAAGSLTISQTARLLKIRGRAMQNAVKSGDGAMAAILGLDFKKIETIVKRVQMKEVCEIANYNEENQIVISGYKNAVLAAMEMAKKEGAKRSILLNVSAPFHCSLMEPAAKIMKDEIQKSKIFIPECPIIMNVDAKIHKEVEIIRKNLFKQITKIVKWKESIQNLSNNGYLNAFEIGNGKTLSGLTKKISPNIKCLSISEIENIKSFFEEINNDKSRR